MTIPPACCRSLLVLVGLLGSGTPMTAQETFVEDFDMGSNVGAWGWGTTNEHISPLNGNPGAFVQDLTLFSHQPTLRNGPGDASVFTGDYSLRNVTSVGVDLVTLNKGFSVEGNRWLTLMLLDDAGTPFDPNDDRGWYFVSDDLVPDAGVPLDASAGWTSYDFAIDARALSAPPGWLPITFGAPAPSWAELMDGVDRVEFWYGAPGVIYLLDSWDVGADNLRITEGLCQEDLGFAGPGDLHLALCGDALETGGVADLTVTGATPFGTVFLALGAAATPTPFKGGTLVPLPLLAVIDAPADGSGAVAFPVPGGGGSFIVYIQAAAADAGQPVGFELSNALAAVFRP